MIRNYYKEKHACYRFCAIEIRKIVYLNFVAEYLRRWPVDVFGTRVQTIKKEYATTAYIIDRLVRKFF